MKLDLDDDKPETKLSVVDEKPEKASMNLVFAYNVHSKIAKAMLDNMFLCLKSSDEQRKNIRIKFDELNNLVQPILEAMCEKFN